MTKNKGNKNSDLILSNRLYVPKKLVTDEMLEQYTYNFNEDKEDPCEGCSSYECEDCLISLDNTIELFKEHDNWYSFARGDLGKLYKIFGHHNIVDDRTVVPLDCGFKWNKEVPLYKNQKKTVNKWLEYGYGQIHAAARSGKTAMSVNIITKLQQKTIILTHLEELLEQFEETFYKFTNILKIEKDIGEEILGYPSSPRDFEQLSICLCTYQSFLSAGGKKKLKNYRDYWGLLICDEVHRSSASGFAGVISQLNAKYRLGLTATPKRKDEHHIIHENVIGPVVVKAKSKNMKCTVNWIRTGYKLPTFYNWAGMLAKMIANTERNKLIIKYIKRDIDKGRHIVAVTNRVAHCKAIAQALQRYGIAAEALWGASPNRSKILDECRSGKIKVLVAMRQIVQVGIDVPIWSSYHCLIPLANKENFYQEMSRIRTPMQGKPKPIINYYLDNHSAMYACKNVVSEVCKKEKFF